MQRNAGTHPLQVFELIQLIGGFIPSWRLVGYDIDWIPKDLLHLCAVSRTCRTALLPVLWRVYDGKVMEHVPNHTISRYSAHFRYFFNCAHLGPFFTTHLHVLDVGLGFGYRLSHLAITQLWPGIALSTLVWSGISMMHAPISLELSGPSGPPPSTAKAPAGEGSITVEPLILCNTGVHNSTTDSSPALLSSMPTTITKLVLQTWTIDDELELLMFLTRFNRLSTLWLSDIHDFNSFPTYSSPSTSTTLSHSSGALTEPLFPSVRTLRLCFTDQHSMALLEIVKCCPNLEQLEIHGGWIRHSGQYKTLMLHPYCPRLTSLSIRLHWDEIEDGFYAPKDPDLALLIKSLTGGPKLGQLKTLKLAIRHFGEHTAGAIADLDTLEVLELVLDDEYDPRYLGAETEASREKMAGHASQGRLHHVLTRLGRLRVLTVDMWHKESSNDNTKHPLFHGEPWACLRSLEELTLTSLGFDTTATQELQGIEVEDERGERWVWRTQERVWISSILKLMITEHVKQMLRLRRFSYKGVSFLKMKPAVQ
ncbi:hypothetical protein BGZ72_001168 [Mortierella alpina]|nr:hypothetical protein BGZ72_001168 [Mortierella alpina]